ncbi:MAG: 16S rRNA (uracil(1498)-N(3))-methyltransferase [Nitrospirota bacterium]
MPRIFLPPYQCKDKTISIVGEKARYLRSVLRCEIGDNISIFEGEGNCLRTVIMKTDKKEIVVEVLEKFGCDVESHFHIVLVQSLLKGEKMDWVIQKTTELGVNEVMPAISERSQLRSTKKIERWRKIAEEASRQSGRTVIPSIHEPINLNEMMGNQFLLQGFIFHEEGGIRLSDAIEVIKQTYNPSNPPFSNPPLPPFSKGGREGLLVVIGPEGGFTKEEVNFARQKGLIVTSLGRRILRAETAAIAAVILTQFLLGDLG